MTPIHTNTQRAQTEAVRLVHYDMWLTVVAPSRAVCLRRSDYPGFYSPQMDAVARILHDLHLKLAIAYGQQTGEVPF